MSSRAERRARLSDEGGFTLIELLVASALLIVVLGATLSVFENFISASTKTNRLTDVQDAARPSLTRMVTMLRNAGPTSGTAGSWQAGTVLRANPNDVIFNTTDWPGESRNDHGAHVARYCLNDTTKTVWFDGMYAPGTTWVDPGADCPSASAGWTHNAVLKNTRNDGDENRLFRYDSVNPASVRAVGINVRLEAGTDAQPRPTYLRSSVSPRGLAATLPTNQTGGPPTPPTPQCQADRSVLFDLTAKYDRDGNPLTYVFMQGDVVLSAAGGAVIVRPTASGSSYSLQVKVTNVLGLSEFLTVNATC